MVNSPLESGGECPQAASTRVFSSFPPRLIIWTSGLSLVSNGWIHMGGQFVKIRLRSTPRRQLHLTAAIGPRFF